MLRLLAHSIPHIIRAPDSERIRSEMMIAAMRHHKREKDRRVTVDENCWW